MSSVPRSHRWRDLPASSEGSSVENRKSPPPSWPYVPSLSAKIAVRLSDEPAFVPHMYATLTDQRGGNSARPLHIQLGVDRPSRSPTLSTPVSCGGLKDVSHYLSADRAPVAEPSAAEQYAGRGFR